MFVVSCAQLAVGFTWAISSSGDVFRGVCPVKISFGVVRYSWLADHADVKAIVNLNRHVSTARRTQPEIFVDAGLACIFRFHLRSMPDQDCFGVDQVELAFAEIAKRTATRWIRALGKHEVIKGSVQMKVE